jgi:CHASE3 domain sensor protein
VARNNVPSIVALSETRAAILSQQRDIRSAILTADPSETALYIESARARLDEIDRAFARYTELPMSQAERAMVGEYQVAHNQWSLTARNALIQASFNTSNGNQVAGDLVLHKNDGSARIMLDVLNRLIAENERQASRAAEAAAADRARALGLTAGILAASLIAVGAGVGVIWLRRRPSSAALPTSVVEA